MIMICSCSFPLEIICKDDERHVECPKCKEYAWSANACPVCGVFALFLACVSKDGRTLNKRVCAACGDMEPRPIAISA